MEKTVILIKPDGMKRGLIGKVIDRFEQAGFKIIAAKLIKMDDELLKTWYAHLVDKPFFGELCQFMKETPVLVMLWQGERIVGKAREICGATDPKQAAPGTIRKEFGGELPKNVIHVSDSAEAAKKEEELIFKKEEIFEY